MEYHIIVASVYLQYKHYCFIQAWIDVLQSSHEGNSQYYVWIGLTDSRGSQRRYLFRLRVHLFTWLHPSFGCLSTPFLWIRDSRNALQWQSSSCLSIRCCRSCMCCMGTAGWWCDESSFLLPVCGACSAVTETNPLFSLLYLCPPLSFLLRALVIQWPLHSAKSRQITTQGQNSFIHQLAPITGRSCGWSRPQLSTDRRQGTTRTGLWVIN